jgi:cytochrome oxidase Cu insertion factor (SCO1/SenC/PrrC family)
VATNPKYDTREALLKWRNNLYTDDLIVLRSDLKDPSKMQTILKEFKVPAGLTPEEVEKTKELFAKQKTWKQKVKGWFSRDTSFDGILNDHSQVMYLMSDDNKFLAFYQLDIEDRELVEQIIEDIGRDIGQRYLGTDKRPQYTE